MKKFTACIRYGDDSANRMSLHIEGESLEASLKHLRKVIRDQCGWDPDQCEITHIFEDHLQDLESNAIVDIWTSLED